MDREHTATVDVLGFPLQICYPEEVDRGSVAAVGEGSLRGGGVSDNNAKPQPTKETPL